MTEIKGLKVVVEDFSDPFFQWLRENWTVNDNRRFSEKYFELKEAYERTNTEGLV